MHIGIDLDNTLICYDGLFHREAVARGWIAPSTPTDKTSVRSALRASGRETLWTELQGHVYGRRIVEAKPYAGAIDFITKCRTRGFRVSIVSHKTRRPFIGADYDLHEACLQWLRDRAIVGDAPTPLVRQDVHLALTREEKFATIASIACDVFIDDLPELLGDPSFPAVVERVLFDPHGQHVGESRSRRAESWSQIGAWIHSLEPVR